MITIPARLRQTDRQTNGQTNIIAVLRDSF